MRRTKENGNLLLFYLRSDQRMFQFFLCRLRRRFSLRKLMKNSKKHVFPLVWMLFSPHNSFFFYFHRCKRRQVSYKRGEKRLNHAFVSKNSLFMLFSSSFILFCYFIKCLYATRNEVEGRIYRFNFAVVFREERIIAYDKNIILNVLLCMRIIRLSADKIHCAIFCSVPHFISLCVVAFIKFHRKLSHKNSFHSFIV